MFELKRMGLIVPMSPSRKDETDQTFTIGIKQILLITGLVKFIVNLQD